MEITVGPYTFDALTAGPSDGPGVLLLHGFPEGAGCWSKVLDLLGDSGLSCVAPDQRGYSPGARPLDVADYALDALVGDAVGMLDSLGWEHAHVVGHDWGAIVAWVLAARHRERVRSLTAVSVPHPSAFGAALRNDADQQRMSAYMRLFREPPDHPERVLLADGAAALRSIFAGSTLEPPQVEVFVAARSEPGALTAALNWYRAMVADDYAAVPPVHVPTTYVWSDGDIAVSRAAATACAEHVSGDYRFVELPEVSHWIPEQAPDLLAALILERVAL